MLNTIIILLILLILILLLNNLNNKKSVTKQSGGKSKSKKSTKKNNKKSVEKFNEMLNIYDEPLEQCRIGNMANGSWDNDGKCSELGGGVHQICINNISKKTPKFSKDTGQSNWSDNRANNNHCVCLGAWSLYNNKNKNIRNKNNILKCDAIPKVALSDKYVSKFSEGWNKWNGLELDNQIKHGVEALVKNCYNPNDKKSIKLKNNYCRFAKKNKALNNTKLYNKLCKIKN